MPTGTRKVLKEEFVVWRPDSDGISQYVNSISRYGVSTTKDIDESMKVPTLDTAKAIYDIAAAREPSKKYGISHIQVMVEDIDISSIGKEEI